MMAVFQSKKSERLALYLSLLWLAITLTSFQGCRKIEDERLESHFQQDLLKHPIYSNYKFSEKNSVINIGIQPLWIPTGHIVETMKRDEILHNELSELGLEIKFYPFLKGSDINYFLKRGDIDIGVGGDMPAITLASSFDIVIPSLFQMGFTSIVANRHMLLTELKDKSIGYAFGSNAHFGLLRALAQEGISEKEVNLVPMDVDVMPKRLETGSISAFSAWEPTPAISLKTNKKSVVIHQSQSTGYIYFAKEFVKKHPKAFRYVIASEIRAIRWIQKERQNIHKASQWALLEAEKLSDRKSDLDVNDYIELARKDILGMLSDPIIPDELLSNDGALRNEFEFLKSIDTLPASVKWDRVKACFDTSVLLEVLNRQAIYNLNGFEYNKD